MHHWGRESSTSRGSDGASVKPDEEMRVPRSILTQFTIVLSVSLGGLAMTACATAASVGDGAIRVASIGRVQATPFSDILEAKDCRAALTATYGYARESRAMKNGVFVVQTYDCAADGITARVSLNNYTSDPMFCFASTENAMPGIWVAPQSVGFFEYSFAETAYQDCSLTPS